MEPFVQVVQYDFTSSSEDEEHQGSNLVISSAYLDAPHLTPESDEQTPVSSDNERPVSPSPTVVKDEPPEEVVEISSDSDDTTCSAVKRRKIEQPQPSCTRAYALKASQLSDNMRQFLKQVRSFFTKQHSLKRHGQFLAETTYLKAEERVCCKYSSV